MHTIPTQLFRISTFGESHGGGVGVIVDGCPPRLHITREEIQKELDRRRYFPPSLYPSLPLVVGGGV
jgi:chorismate synthase